MNLITLPNGLVADWDALPEGNKAGQPGKFCPITGVPLDEAAVHSSHSHGEHGGPMAGESVKARKLEAIQEFHKRLKASSPNDPTPVHMIATAAAPKPKP